VTPSLPFSIGHAILAATTTKAPPADPEFVQLVIPSSPQPDDSIITPEQRKQHALAIARKMTEMGYDPEWLSVPKNRAIVEAKLPDMIVDRPAAVIGMLLSFGLFPCDSSSSVTIFSTARVLIYGDGNNRIKSFAARPFVRAFLLRDLGLCVVCCTAISSTGPHRAFYCILRPLFIC